MPRALSQLVARRVKLRAWQRKELRKISRTARGARSCHLAARTERRPLRPTACISSDRKQGRTRNSTAPLNAAIGNPVQPAKVVRMSPELSDVVTVCEELGTIYKALSAEASTAYGLSPIFIVHDELGQVKGPHSELYEVPETAPAANRRLCRSSFPRKRQRMAI